MWQHLPFRLHTAHCAHSTARAQACCCTPPTSPKNSPEQPAQKHADQNLSRNFQHNLGFLHGAFGNVELCWALPVLLHSCCSEYNTAQQGMHHAAASAKRIKHQACSQCLRSRQLACSMVRTKKHAAETSRGQANSQAPVITPTAHACTATCRRRQAVTLTLVVGQPVVCALQLHMCCQTATGPPPSHICPHALTTHPPTQTPGGTLALV